LENEQDELALEQVVPGLVKMNTKGYLVIDPDDGYNVNQADIKCQFNPAPGILIYILNAKLIL